jgi:hypothetical protein
MINNSQLIDFVDSVENFNEKSSAEQLELFSFFLMDTQNSFTINDIKTCFDIINTPQYSNINQYLNRYLKSKYIKKDSKTYVLTKKAKDNFDILYKENRKAKPASNSLFPLEIIMNTRKYIEDIGKEAVVCYDSRLYNAAFVLLRRLIETLIIEVFEKFSCSDKIKVDGGFYMHLHYLIEQLLSQNDKWNIGRNASVGFRKIKEKGDLAAHNRRFLARKSDIDDLKEYIRVCIEELIHIADFK